MKKLFATAVAFLMLAPVPAQAQRFAISGHVGSTGVGGGAIVGLAPKLNLRGMFSFVPGDPEVEIEGIDFAFDLPTFILTTVDYYPVSGFHISAGGLLVSKGGDLTAIGTAAGRTEEFGGNSYTFTAQDRLVSTFSLKSFQPYAGIGFGNGIGKLIGINLDVGLGFGERPTVTIVPQGPLANDPLVGAQFQADVQTEVQDIENDIPEYFKFYPVVALSVSIGF